MYFSTVYKENRFGTAENHTFTLSVFYDHQVKIGQS